MLLARLVRRLAIIMIGENMRNSSDVSRWVKKNMTPPMTMGARSMAGEKGCLRRSLGLRGSVNTVGRVGRVSRGGRLKSTVGAPAVGVTTASASGTGPIMSWVVPTLRTVSAGQRAGPFRPRRSSSISRRRASGSCASGTG